LTTIVAACVGVYVNSKPELRLKISSAKANRRLPPPIRLPPSAQCISYVIYERKILFCDFEISEDEFRDWVATIGWPLQEATLVQGKLRAQGYAYLSNASEVMPNGGTRSIFILDGLVGREKEFGERWSVGYDRKSGRAYLFVFEPVRGI
jgi:hypothetical protein